VRSFEDSNGAPFAVVRPRDERSTEAGAEIIDLVHLPSGARPTPFAELDFEEVPRARVLDCDTYNECLELAARVRWAGFHCRQCPKACERTRLAAGGEPHGSSVEREDAPIIRLR
jgi:hypothetical protein